MRVARRTRRIKIILGVAAPRTILKLAVILQSHLGLEVSPSTQWDLCEELANAARPIYIASQKLAASFSLFYGDDISFAILSEKGGQIKIRRLSGAELNDNLKNHHKILTGRMLDLYKKTYKIFDQASRLPSDQRMNLLEKDAMLARVDMFRRNAWFYKNMVGAWVSDVLMSLGQTTKLMGGNPYDYFLQILRHQDKVRDNPQGCMPWNYQQNLTA